MTITLPCLEQTNHDRRPRHWSAISRLLTFIRCAAAIQLLTFGLAEAGIPPDAILYNGNVITVNSDFDIAEGLAILDKRIVAVGSSEAIEQLAGPATEKIDLDGKSVIPGMNDAHTHATLAALAAKELNGRYKINLFDAPNMAVALDRISKQVSARSEGAWIVTSLYRGDSFDEPEIKDALNEISPNSLVYLRITGKTFLLNGYGLRLLDLDSDANLPDSGAARDDLGMLTGYFYDEAAEYVRRRLADVYFQIVEPRATRFVVTDGVPPMDDVWEWPAEAYYEGFKHVQRHLNAVGVTGIREMGVWPEYIKAYQALARDGELTVRVNLVIGLPTRFVATDELLEWIKNLSRVPLNSFGNHEVNFGGLKLDAGNPNFQGEKVRQTILAANRLGWRLNIHHRGVTGTTRLVVNALMEADKEVPIEDRRFALEHNFNLEDQAVYRFLADNNVIVAPNPLYDFFAYAPKKFESQVYSPWKSFEKSAGGTIPEQYAFRDYEQAGLTVTLGTDYPAVHYDIEHPLLGMYVAITKQTLGGEIGDYEQRASRQDALRYLTINAAYATFEEDVRGSIEPGKLADLVVLSDDPMSVSTEDLKDIVVLRTIMNGRTVYRR